jgi:hypothetical protein
MRHLGELGGAQLQVDVAQIPPSKRWVEVRDNLVFPIACNGCRAAVPASSTRRGADRRRQRGGAVEIAASSTAAPGTAGSAVAADHSGLGRLARPFRWGTFTSYSLPACLAHAESGTNGRHQALSKGPKARVIAAVVREGAGGYPRPPAPDGTSPPTVTPATGLSSSFRTSCAAATRDRAGSRCARSYRSRRGCSAPSCLICHGPRAPGLIPTAAYSRARKYW